MIFKQYNRESILMKRLILSLLMLVPLVAGCANIDTKITINDDKSASVASSITYQGDLSDKTDFIGQNIVSNYEKFLDDSYSVENAYGAKFSTITASKAVKNLKFTDLDLSSLGFVSNLPSKKFIEIKKNFLVSSFNIDMTYNYKTQAEKFQKIEQNNQNTKAQNVTGGLTPEYFQKYGDSADFDTDKTDTVADNLDDATKQFTKDSMPTTEPEQNLTDKDLKTSLSIQVPSFASYNNADSMSGNIYTWNIKKDAPTTIKLQYVQYSGFAIAFVILLGVLILVLIAKRIIKRDSQKRLDNIENVV